MTEFTHNISLLVPPEHYTTASALIACISGEPADLLQFGSPKFGAYDACNIQAKASHVQAVLAAAAGKYTPSRPTFDTDEQINMTAVLEMIDAMQVVTIVPESPLPLLSGTLIVGIDIDAATLAQACGLERAIND